MENHKIWIVVPVFNREKEIYSFLNQMFSQTFQNFIIVVVDHGTTAIDFSAFKDFRLRIVREDSSLWWTGAINSGIAMIYGEIAANDSILLINDDVVIDSDYLQNISAAAGRNPNSIVGSTGVDANNQRVIYTGRLLNKPNARFYSPHNGYKYSEIRETGGICESHILFGRGMLIPFKIMESVGKFNDDRLSHYGADSEYSWRAHKMGIRVICALDAPVYIKEKKSEYPVDSNDSLIGHLTYKRRAGNFSAMSNFALLSFSTFYASYFILLNSIRKSLSYFKTKYQKA